MYNIKLTDYVPEPQPATSDYLVCAHYYAAWKKGAAEIHGGFDDLHDYPERIPLAGYYDEENPEYTDWEIKWAVEHGINCFIYCWYRRKENVGHPVTGEGLRCGHGLHEALFNARYQKYMKFAIMFEASSRWGSTTPDDMMENLMPFWMEEYFKRGNYLIVNNKPVLFVYEWQEFGKAFANARQQAEVFEKCRQYCKACGFDGMIIAAQERRADKALREEILERGFDFAFSYNWFFRGEENAPENVLIDAQYKYYKQHIDLDPKSYIPTASCFWDPEPRTTQHWKDLGFTYGQGKYDRTWYINPDGFRETLKKCKELSDSLPDTNQGKGIIMIDNWNEWDEGHYVAPSHRFGFRYLQAIREELTHRNNLPDYRMPQDLGLSDFNKSWDTPDLGEICKKRFNLK